jgi:hypothetical protein
LSPSGPTIGCYGAAKWLKGHIDRFGGGKFNFFTEEGDRQTVKQTIKKSAVIDPRA